MQCPAPAWVAQAVCGALERLHAAQTAPFTAIYQDHLRCLKTLRETQVRMAQLDKEGAELREENMVLSSRVSGVDDVRARASGEEVASAKADAVRLDREVSSLYKDKARLLEELVGAGADMSVAKKSSAALQEKLNEALARCAELTSQLNASQATLVHESSARQAAADEVASARTARDTAEEESGRLREENAALVRRLVQLKENEVERMNQINNLHEEALQQAMALRKEAAADKEAAELIRRHLMAGHVAGGPPGAQQQQQQPGPLAAAAAAVAHAVGDTAAAAIAAARGVGSSGPSASPGAGDHLSPGAASLNLRGALGLPAGGSGGCARVLPRAPSRMAPVAHKGGCCALAAQTPGHLVTSCGMTAEVHLWDASMGGGSGGMLHGGGAGGAMRPAATLTGMTAGVYDVAFTADGAQVLGAGADKSLHVWDVSSGQTRHTLTGHSAAVTGVDCDPLDAKTAASCSEDRCIKLWDLSRGFCVRSLPCTKMPSCLLMARDGSTVVTGHVDGTVCLWDARAGARGGGGMAGPVLEAKDHTQAICALACTSNESTLLIVSRDNTVCLWDFRVMSTQSTLRAPGFAVGTIGSMGRGRCHVEMSVDGRFVAVGAADGGVYVWDMGSGASALGHTSGGGASAPGPSPVVLRYHKDAVVACSFSSDVSSLVTADRGGAVCAWSLVSDGE